LILDVRGFPREALSNIVKVFTRHPTPALHTYTPLRTSHSLVSGHTTHVTETIILTRAATAPSALNYQGKIVVLVNEKTAAASEQQLLYLERLCAGVCGGVTCIGTPTNGCLGKMTNVKLPGDIFIGLSGVGVTPIDGKQIHGVGIIPQITVEPTVLGIAQGIDEVYEKAIQYCKSYLQYLPPPVGVPAVETAVISDDERVVRGQDRIV